ncbi:MAG: agmatine deiminase family protein [Bacteroidales bacterium]|nr:agmatine deiminase family protein [Bacteroidales bacterium]
MKKSIIQLPPEWAEQDAIQLTWPHEESDWAPMLDEVEQCYTELALAIMRYQPLIIVCRDAAAVRLRMGKYDPDKVHFIELPSNDTWARDHGGISVFEDGKPVLCDFTFNGWGMKFAADKDNLITRRMFEEAIFSPEVCYKNCLHFVLEGGSIETDGEGTLLTTAECLLSPNRNDFLTKEEIEKELGRLLGFDRFLWLSHGYLRGDDTDSHIDTLARLCDRETIAYVRCTDEGDEHYPELKEMEKELQTFRTRDGKPYRLIALPMADRVECDGERLPATYANFLILNGAVLMPTYNSPKDDIALQQLQKAFPGRSVTGVNCLPLIKQHGSLHCVTMQYPKGFIYPR